MKVKIFGASAEVGEAEICAIDPPMCVAVAKFFPAKAYNQASHANIIDGGYVGDRSEILRIEMQDGSALKSEAISIQDLPTLDERAVHIFGIYEPSFDELFRGHPDFKAYWGRA